MVRITYMSLTERTELKGVGGWLGFYVWSNLITLPFFITMMFWYPEYIKSVPANLLEYFPKDFPLHERMMLAAVAFINNCACLMLLGRKSGAVKLAKQALLAQIGFVIARFAISAYALYQSGQLIVDFIAILDSLLVPFAWYLYFKRSVRIQNTFSGDL